MTDRDNIKKARELAAQVQDDPGPSVVELASLGVKLAECASQLRDPEHNGWENYPTWAVALWLDNEEGLYNEARALTRMHLSTAPDDENVPEIWTAEQAARFRLADTLKAWVRDDLAPDLGASFSADLLGWAFDHVAWDEIAQSRIDAEAE